jgi:predicted nucleotidyltransferase
MQQRIRDILDELRRHFQQLYGPRLVKMILYGSQARGDAVEGSDIDVLVVLEGPVNSSAERRRNIDFIASLCLRESELVSVVYMGRREFLMYGGPFLMNVRLEGVPI